MLIPVSTEIFVQAFGLDPALSCPATSCDQVVLAPAFLGTEPRTADSGDKDLLRQPRSLSIEKCDDQPGKRFRLFDVRQMRSG